MYEFNGIVKKIGKLQAFTSGFTKRDLILEEEKDGDWQNVVAFSFKREKTSMLDGVALGSRVKVSFSVDGREWKDPKSGQTRYFTDLTALKLDVFSNSATPAAATNPELEAIDEVEDGTIPF